MNNFIPEEEYQKIMKTMPVFCVDFMIRCKDKILLIKRKEEPCKDVYWVVGGRLRFQETIEQLAERVQMKEIGRYFPKFKLYGFSNSFFPNVPNARATHTPTLLYVVDVEEIFDPIIDDNHSDFIWSSEIPEDMKKQIVFV